MHARQARNNLPMTNFRQAFAILSLALADLHVVDPAAAEMGDLKHPDWHPEGKHLLAEGSCAGSIDLYLIDLQSGSVRLVWEGEFTEGYPRWFPDGKRIAFHRIDDARESHLYLAELSLSGEISDVHRISPGPFDIEPSPSPDGTQLVYSQQGDKGLDIALFDLGRGEVGRVWKTEVAENFPSWYPDGASITFYARNGTDTQIYSFDLDSDQPDALTSGPGPNFIGDLSPDGALLAYSSERTGDREIYLRDLASGEEQQMTDRAGRDAYVKFSPDGKQLAYHSGIESGPDSYVVIRLLDIESGETSEFSCRAFFGVL